MSTVDNIQRLTVVWRGLTVDKCQVLGSFPSLESLTLNLVSLRLLKAPGTAIGNKPVKVNKNVDSEEAVEVPRFPPSVVELDLRDTPIGDDWLLHSPCAASCSRFPAVRNAARHRRGAMAFPAHAGRFFGQDMVRTNRRKRPPP